MSSVWANNLKISIFGESHGPYIGAVLDNLPAGEKIDIEEINFQMQKRAPGKNSFSSKRLEPDCPEIVSGIFNGCTTGAPICAIIKNQNANSSDYEKFRSIPRPGTADYTAFKKYNSYNDFRGGGHLSGRLTAPLVFCGSVCQQILKRRGIIVAAHIFSVGNVFDNPFSHNISEDVLKNLHNQTEIPVLNPNAKDKIKSEIDFYKNKGDTIGGTIECAICGIEAGIGDPIFCGVENVISSLIFAIPAVKGIEFGSGFKVSSKRGSENNDQFIVKDGQIQTETNNHGGILGGISSGMPIIFRVAIKPTPSHAFEQSSVDLNEETTAKIKITGRHDPCIVPRAVPAVEAVASIAILDLLLGSKKI